MLRIGSVCIQMCGNYGIKYSEKESDALPTSDRIVSCVSHIHCNEETVKLVYEMTRPTRRHRIQSR